MDAKIEGLLKHFTEQPADEIKKYAKDNVLKGSEYIFIESGPYGKAYCTSCDKHLRVEGKVKTGTRGVCPHCAAKCIYKHAWRGRNSLYHQANFLYFEKSILDTNVVTATWYHALKDYRKDYVMKEIELEAVARYVFLCETGESYLLEHAWWQKKWLCRDEIITPDAVRNGIMRRIASHSIPKAVEGTKLMYSQWTKYYEGEYPKYFALFLRYPSIEILNKAGKQSVVNAKLYGQRTYSAINWRATKLHNIFKVDKADFIKLDAAGADLFDYSICQLLRKEKSKADLKEFIKFANKVGADEDMGILKFLRKYVTLHRMMNYVNKQFALDQEHYKKPHEVMITWRDYIEDCIRLDMDLNDDAIKFPRDLYTQHQETLKKVEYVENEKLRVALLSRKEQLKEYDGFTNKKYVVLVPSSPKEIIEEGKALRHCVGGYAERHVKGECTILFVRDVKEPKKPLYTLELRGGKIQQLRGLANMNAPKDARDFVDQMLKEKVITKKTKRKARKTA